MRLSIAQIVNLLPLAIDAYKAFCVLDNAARKRGFNTFDTAKEQLEIIAASMREKALDKPAAPTKAEQTSFDRASGGTSG
jgi:hypothetical protein